MVLVVLLTPRRSKKNLSQVSCRFVILNQSNHTVSSANVTVELELSSTAVLGVPGDSEHRPEVMMWDYSSQKKEALHNERYV